MVKISNALPLPLDYPEVRPLPPAANAVSQAVENLWLCIHLPCFSLDVLAVDEADKAHVVLYEQKGRWLIHSANKMARDGGVVAHMSLNAAYALCPELQAHRRDYLQEQSQLKRLADWAYQFSPEISILESHGLLLEVRGSLQLFGGLSPLLAHIEQTLQQEWSYHTQMALTPSALASQTLAQYGQAVVVEQSDDLRSVLSDLPIEALVLEDLKLFQKLRNIGVRHLKDLWRLPRPDMARRFGQALIKHLDQLLGLAPDVRLRHEVPLCFDESLELPAEIFDRALIVSSAELLLKRLVLFLQQQDAGINRLLLRLYHYEHSATHVSLGLRQSSRDYQQILDLLQQQMEKVQLPSKVNALRLSVKDILPLEACSNRLFPTHLLADEKQQNDPEWDALLEQLQNRLGSDALQYLDMREDHRPEFAWCYQRNLGNDSTAYQLARPSWLLRTPAALSMRNGVPCFRGQLHCLHGPERIQSGWWEKQEVCRDYYVAQDIDNRRLWIFRDLTRKAAWYLHGFFA